MNKKFKQLFSRFDFAVLGYFVAGTLLMICITEVFTGQYLRAFSSFLYAFVVLGTVELYKENKHLKRLLALQDFIIEVYEEKTFLRSKEASDQPESPTFEESQGEKKED